MVNFDKIIERIGELKGVTGGKQVAATLGLSPQDFSNRKKRGSLMPAVIEWAINETVNLEWLFRGESNQYVSEEMSPYINADPIIEKINRHLEQMSEADRKAIEQIAATLAGAQKTIKKAR